MKINDMQIEIKKSWYNSFPTLKYGLPINIIKGGVANEQ